MRGRVSLLAGLALAVLPLAGLTLITPNAGAASNLAAKPRLRERGYQRLVVHSGPRRVTSPVHTRAGALSATPSASDTGQCSQPVSATELVLHTFRLGTGFAT
jgi:hypothetical protein